MPQENLQEVQMFTVARALPALLCMLSFALTPAAVAARAAGPLVEHENVAATTGDGKSASADQIRRAFLAGGARRNWTFTDEGPNKLVGRLNVRTHQISVDIPIAEGKFSVLYRDSVNMKYGMEDGKKMIHPQYNNWVNNLLGDMRAELARQ
jgi:hypothetical protein